MKGKIAILVAVSITLGVLSLYLTNRVANYQKILADRELQITQYKRLLDIIVTNIEIDYTVIKNDLEKSYILSYPVADTSNREIILAEPIKHEINKESLWDFTGAIEIQLSENGRIEYIWNNKY